LTLLNISSNDIEKDGARYIAEALEVNITLNYLEFSANEIGDKGAESISEALKKNTALNLLDLTETRIGEKGAGDIAKALEENTTLTILNIRDIQIVGDFEDGIKPLIERNRKIKDFYIFYLRKLSRWKVQEITSTIPLALIQKHEDGSAMQLAIKKNVMKEPKYQDIIEYIKHREMEGIRDAVTSGKYSTMTINEMRMYTSIIEKKDRANLKRKQLGALYLAIEAAYISGSNKK